MKIEITKITKEFYLVNGKSVLFEKGKWRPQILSLTTEEHKAFKQHLHVELYNKQNQNYANSTIGTIRDR